MSGLRHPAIIACAYMAMAVFTFGRSASAPHECFDNWAGKASDFCPYRVIGSQAAIAGIFWPFYWSWVIQS